MARTRKPLWRWEPAPYCALIALMLVTGTLASSDLSIAYGIALGITIVAVAAFIGFIVVGAVRGPGNPDSSGILTSLGGLSLVPVDPSDGPRTPVVDARRHQATIDTAQAMAGHGMRAVLAPNSTRWLGMRYRIAVHLVAAEHVYHAGYLPEQSTERYNARLARLAARGDYIAADAVLIGSQRPFALELDLAGLPQTLDTARDQRASS